MRDRHQKWRAIRALEIESFLVSIPELGTLDYAMIRSRPRLSGIDIYIDIEEGIGENADN